MTYMEILAEAHREVSGKRQSHEEARCLFPSEVTGLLGVGALTDSDGDERDALNRWYEREDEIADHSYSRGRDQARAYRQSDLQLARDLDIIQAAA